jgi:hypothetical protein
MSTKNTIQSLINTNLADASTITASEHREVEYSLLNEIYPTVAFETRASNSITNENSNVQFVTNDYQINIAKQGRKVTIYGTIINGSAFIVGDTLNAWFFEIVNSEYLQKTGTYAYGNVRASNWSSFVYLNNNKLFCNGISQFQTYYFTITYFTEN